MQAYNYKDFEKACKNRKVVIHSNAMDGAMKDFYINNENELLDLIVSGDLGELEFINSTPFRLSDDANPPMVDAYDFRFSGRKGYLAFFKIPDRRDKWALKSFKLNIESNLAFKEAFEKLGLPHQGGKDEEDSK